MATPIRLQTAPLNLAVLVKPLPPVILPNGTEHALNFTAHAAQLYRGIRQRMAELMDGQPIDELLTEDEVDACLKEVMASATPDDLASLGTRIEYKLTILAAAAGRLDEVMQALHAVGNAPEAGAAPPLSLDTTSAPS